MPSLNVVAISGNLTRDPELKTLASGTSLAKLRVAVNDRVKRQDEWTDTVYYFDVTAWGRMGENCAQYLGRGQHVEVSGKLTWREWEAQDGTKRQAVEIIANQVVFGPRRDSNGGGGRREPEREPDYTPAGGSVGGDEFRPSEPAADDFNPARDFDNDVPFAWIDNYEEVG